MASKPAPQNPAPTPALAASQRLVMDADVRMRRGSVANTPDQTLWVAIRNRTDAIGYDHYDAFLQRLLQGPATGDPATVTHMKTEHTRLLQRPTLLGGDAYQLLKLATQAFLLVEAGVHVTPPSGSAPGDTIPSEQTREGGPISYAQAQQELGQYLQSANLGTQNPAALPYLHRIVNALLGGAPPSQGSPLATGLLHRRFTHPSLIELIWSYWMEQGMLVQSVKALLLRFQNQRSSPNDALRNLALDPLRPLGNLLWGYLQDEPSQLTIARRAYEYDHEYGLRLVGRAVPQLDSAESRSRFLEAFHTMLHRAMVFYQEDAQTTVISDGFALLNSLREVHMLLAEGACNQFGDLPSTARAEMLVMQWLLARPEMREFLRGRPMAPYAEPWMAQVEAMKRLQGWPDIGVNHFRDLARFGEQILLSVRYGDWMADIDQESARAWARSWRPEVQSYVHAYHAVTGVDLAADITDTRQASVRFAQPSEHLQRRLPQAARPRALPMAPTQTSAASTPALESEYTELIALPGQVRSRLALRRPGP